MERLQEVLLLYKSYNWQQGHWIFFLLLTLGRTWNIAIVSINGDSPPGLFIAYLMKIEDVRDFILDDMYGISPCTIAPLETLIDSCFEFSILVNLLVVSRMTARAFLH